MEQYFLRMRGQVSGPYSLAQLHNLRSRGQLGRFHEVSQDQVHWAAASEVAALFPPGPQLAPSGAPATAAPALATVAEWYYMDRKNQQQGPVSLQDLQGLLDAGQADAETLACKPGLPEWLPLMSFLELRLPQTSAAGIPTSPKRQREEPAPAGPSVTQLGLTEPLPRLRTSRTALLVGIVLAPLVGIVTASVAGYLALASFEDEEIVMGWINLVLLLVVLVLTGIGTYFLAVDYRKKREEQETRGGYP